MAHQPGIGAREAHSLFQEVCVLLKHEVHSSARSGASIGSCAGQAAQRALGLLQLHTAKLIPTDDPHHDVCVERLVTSYTLQINTADFQFSNAKLGGLTRVTTAGTPLVRASRIGFLINFFFAL